VTAMKTSNLPTSLQLALQHVWPVTPPLSLSLCPFFKPQRANVK
jgi:hypothetical protein